MVAMRCPRCHRATDASAWRCGCGHELDGGAERVRALLRDRQVGAWAVLALMLVLDFAAVSCAILAALDGFIVTAALSLTVIIQLTARAVRWVRTTRARLRQLAALVRAVSPAELPRAVVHRR
jgi:cobalamin synthase